MTYAMTVELVHGLHVSLRELYPVHTHVLPGMRVISYQTSDDSCMADSSEVNNSLTLNSASTAAVAGSPQL